ncbi:putative disease resistance protein At3g14460 isoform X1 [Arachis ipaensis]|uniref:putative disease resistance protein At3g14460 isoform X1 n=1 Tax=Arachis ipaensis TaxID=130454 RepID=UPI000A2B5B19|nr:putative disease resistance protein At3g14460 isoform X1 [Arachis ipaensis]XP_020972232.1 putative disease resistance protein At3g14460 isoform X1 [Arachis ipaensis]XP_020972233.1 putative disease resistance protein At3g14460 isoform X1 [Arachis ipaensis]XP_020972234.1 putative disease resistance protein At3g14460 isoform X1 [Arachis ipaensis]
MLHVSQGRAYLSSYVDAVLNKLSSLDINSTPEAKKLADHKLFRRLKASLRATRPVLDDAEQKQIRDQEVNKCLVDLQDALYMADDLLDELSTKAATATPTQRDPGNSSSWSHSVDSILEDGDDDEMGVVTRMQDIVDKLESIVEEKDDLDLKQGVAKDLEDMSWRIQSSLLESPDIYGRNDDKEAIIKLLLDETCDDKFSVISIEGIGGIGKTTLAQWVYNDARLKDKFTIKAWVCVAIKFDPVNVTKAIIEDIASSPCNMVNLNSIQTELKEKLTGKTFLVVLDDVWDNQQNLWDNFLKPFLSGSKGSKILLTTRNQNVDSIVSTTNLHYKLDTLSNEDCWSLFLKHSTISTSSRQYVILEQIGKKIVEKCKGLPLAVKTLGGLLRSKDKVEDWENILRSEIWELPEDESRIVAALRVSYHYLPSNLKRCFVYCSLYPQDYQFDKDELILLWMAEGLLQTMEKNTLENIGCAYFDELVARSFFQLYSADAGLFVMHDLMHDLATLATSFAAKFFFRVDKFGNPHMADSKTRHLSYNRGRISKFPKAYNGAIHMRTFLPIDVQSNDIESDFGIKQLKCLRVLSFHGFKILSLSDSIGELIHLRYLDLSETPIVTLPESLCRLYNLQTLKLRDCEKLEMLPSRMQDLVNLRHLDIRGADSLKEMPKGMSKLKHLNFLSGYIVREQVENGIGELGALDDLHGSLCISKLENVKDSGEALEAKMGNKKHINILELKWISDDDDGKDDDVDFQKERNILEELQPHRNLKEVSIDGYRGEIFPDWLGFSCFSNMTKLSLRSCKNCRQLPSLGQLPSLQHLRIFKLDGLERIGGEFYNNAESCHQGTPFRSLQTLEFCDMPRWREWRIPDGFDGFLKLKSLLIQDCPVLSGDLPADLPALEKLTIRNCEELACSLPRAPKLHQLNVMGSGRFWYGYAAPHDVVIKNTQLVMSILEWLPHFQSPCLERLKIHKCSSAISISGDYLPDSLQFLKISGCSNLTISEPLQHKSLTEIIVFGCDSLTMFPLGALPNLKTLYISSCRRLVSVPALGFAAPHLDILEIHECPEMDCFGEECLPPSLTTLGIRRCQKLERWITWRGLQSEGLTRLLLHRWNEVKWFPREGCLPASLQYLHLSSFSNLETLDCRGLHQLTSLKQLKIENCPKLENITQQNLPASISKLRIKGECPLGSNLEEMNDPRIQSQTVYVCLIADSDYDSDS